MDPRTRRTVSLKHVLYSEILSVTTAMRKNSRWASSTQFVRSKDSALGSKLGLRISTSNYASQTSGRGNREAELMGGFQELKRTVRGVDDITTIGLPTILAPFFALIKSPLSTGPITSAALSALHRLFVCGFISPTSIALEHALVELSSTVSHCKFEASDTSGDEVVLLKIMAIIEDCLCGDVGRVLGDIEVCEMLETVLTTCCQIRLSETLRRSAENTMHALVRTVFSRLHYLDPATEEAKLRTIDEVAPEGEIKLIVSPIEKSTKEVSREVTVDSQEVMTENTVELKSEGAAIPLTPVNPGADRPQYGLPSILELLRVLINVLDPTDQQHTDSTRLVALSILNTAFEESGLRIAEFPSLEALVLDPGCKYLFQLARSDNTSVLHFSLRTISTVFDTMRHRLKLQQELFLAFTIDRLALPSSPPLKGSHAAALGGKRTYTGSPRTNTPRPGTPMLYSKGGPDGEQRNQELESAAAPSRILIAPARGETRNLILDTLSQISRHPSFMVDLYANYDCDINCENLFERLVDFLTKAVYPTDYPAEDVQQRNAQYMCLDLLLAFVNDMAARAEGVSDIWPAEFPTPESLIQTKSQKKLILTGASRFNAKPKSGIAFLEDNKLIYTDLSEDITKARSLAYFLKGCTRLDKRLLGDYISKPDNIELLKAFIGLFDFRNKPIADALRELLESFRLPGEAQQISRITETFASAYFASGPEEIKNEDAVYVLAYSVILLNTDLHNPQVRQNIYDSIRKREIVMPEEHTGQLGFEHAWKELLTRSRQAGNYMICNSSVFDVEMFKIVWKPVISAIAYAFISFEEEYIIQRSISGFRQCATLAGHFNLPDVFDFVVVSLSEATSLLSDVTPAQVPNYPLIEVEGQSLTVSNLSVKFGTNFKGQLAAVVLFNIVNGNGNALREGWTQLDIDALTAAVRALEALAHERTVTRLKQEFDDGLTHSDKSFSLPYDPASVFFLETMVSILCQAPHHIEELWSV
ncbi:hypothetical protein C0993_003393 [Termitomyces sp. T159_Od127]|nr:hypothetical protein C0993_003393 [Termitomyces sp. T159_Od127]